MESTAGRSDRPFHEPWLPPRLPQQPPNRHTPTVTEPPRCHAHSPAAGLPFRAWRDGWGHRLCIAVLQQLLHRQGRVCSNQTGGKPASQPASSATRAGLLSGGRRGKATGRPPATPLQAFQLSQPHRSTLAPTGAQLRQWYLAGTATGDIQSQDASLAVLSPAAATSPSGGMAAVFTLQQSASQSPIPLIFAAGGVYNDGTMRWVHWPNLGEDGLRPQGKSASASRRAAAGLGCAVAPQPQHLHLHASSPRRQHSQYGSGTLDLSTGTLSDPEVETDPISSIIAVGRCSAFLFLTGSADPWLAWSAPSDQACVWWAVHATTLQQHNAHAS